MTPAALLTSFRQSVFDENAPFLWSDDEFYEFATDAQEMFTRLTGGIADSTTASVTQLTATASTEYTAISPLILKIRLARRADFRSLEILNFEDAEGAGREDDYGSQWRGNRLDATEGPLAGMISGMEQDQVRWLPIPAVTETVMLTVDRLPLKSVTAGTKFEIHAHHHIHLLHWIKYRAYSKADAETFDKTRAGESKNRFNEYVDGLARIERNRRRHKYRTVQYRGL